MNSTADLALATRGLRKSYGKRLALDGLDLSVPEGVVYGFLGPNGAGKTTTMRLLTGLLHPDAGTHRAARSPFRRGDRKRLFEVGALVENPSFYPYLSGRKNLQVLAAAGAPVPARPDRRAARARRAKRAGEGQGQRLLPGHEAAARDRRGAALRPEAAAPRRARQRPRPGGHRRDARDAPPPRGAWARRSSSRATSSPRCGSSPTWSGSSRPASSFARGRSIRCCSDQGVVRVRVCRGATSRQPGRCWSGSRGRMRGADDRR